MKCQKWQLSLAHQWAKRASIAKRSFSVLSTTEESGRASISRPHTKHEISALSAAGVFCQAQRTTGAKIKSTYLR